MTRLQTTPSTTTDALETLRIVPFPHPQGCRSYLINDPDSGQTLALDVHLDLVEALTDEIQSQRWSLPYVVDSHTHADHPSGAAALAERFTSTRIAHASARHAGVTRHPDDGDVLHLGDHPITVYHCPGHTPDHIVLVGGGALFSGDTLHIGGVARADFLGGDAGALFEAIQRLLALLPAETVLHPGHDYNGKLQSTLGDERESNPWLQIEDRAEFIAALTANPPPEPVNMGDLLRLNRKGVGIPLQVTAAAAVDRVRSGGAASIIDVRTDIEFQGEHIPGSVHIPLDQLAERADAARAVPAPRLLVCRSGSRAELALQSLDKLGLGGLAVVVGGLDAYRRAGGETLGAGEHISLERQVRIVAGALIVLFVTLGYVAHAAFFAFAGLIGVGQIFAGISDWCGMGLLLARMPWNRGGASEPGANTPPGACAAQPPAAAGK